MPPSSGSGPAVGDAPLGHVSRPGSIDTDAPAAVFIHGRGADEHDLLPIGARFPEEIHVLSVRAPDRLGPGYTWYDLDLTGGGLHASQPDPDGFRRSLDRLEAFVEWAVDHYVLDRDRVGLVGFSQGAIMSLSALLERPDRYRWVVALNGYLAASHEDRVDTAAGKPVFIGCGATDKVIPSDRAERAADLLQAAGAAVRFEQYPVGHGTTPEEIADVTEWLTDHY